MADLANALTGDREQIPAAEFPHFVKGLPGNPWKRQVKKFSLPIKPAQDKYVTVNIRRDRPRLYMGVFTFTVCFFVG